MHPDQLAPKLHLVARLGQRLRQSLCDVRECGLCVLGYIETLRHCGLVNLGWEPRGGVTKIELQRIGCYVILKIIEFHWDSGRLRYFDLDAHAS